MGKSWIWHLFLQMAFHPVRPCWSASAQDFASNSGHAPSQGSHTPTHHHQKNMTKTKKFAMVHDGSLVHAIKMEYNRSGPSIRSKPTRIDTEHLNTYYLRRTMSHCTASIVTSPNAKYVKHESHANSISLTYRNHLTHTHKTQGLQSNVINLGISNSNFKTCESLTSVISWTCQQLWNFTTCWMDE